LKSILCQAQVAAIAGTKEAITLFSSAKYLQAPTEQADFVPVFGGKQSKFPVATISLDAGQHQVWLISCVTMSIMMVT
jgi:WAS family protein 1